MIQSSPIQQIAYFVYDVREAALQHSLQFGSGPYYISEHIPLIRCLHRGKEAVLDHTSAYGQWGGVMVEFVQQNNPGPSVFHDVYPEHSRRTGLHHVALFIEDLKASCASFEAQGLPLALYAEMEGGFAFAMADALRRYGHMIELYEAVPMLKEFYAWVAKASRGFDGVDPIREVSSL